MALADVCGFDLGGKSKLSLGFGEDFSGPSAVDALAASQSFTVPQGIDVRRNVMLQFIHFCPVVILLSFLVQPLRFSSLQFSVLVTTGRNEIAGYFTVRYIQRHIGYLSSAR